MKGVQCMKKPLGWIALRVAVTTYLPHILTDFPSCTPPDFTSQGKWKAAAAGSIPFEGTRVGGDNLQTEHKYHK